MTFRSYEDNAGIRVAKEKTLTSYKDSMKIRLSARKSVHDYHWFLRTVLQSISLKIYDPGTSPILNSLQK